MITWPAGVDEVSFGPGLAAGSLAASTRSSFADRCDRRRPPFVSRSSAAASSAESPPASSTSISRQASSGPAAGFVPAVT